ncbi:dihydroorotate dehydrogenase electron transfer subunit [Desulforhopalus singaporensis]|uniref:Dihydroorotate oxidase B, electron transfer subunit n=1 Tax=Desulforhopalus singaporensis TaxID=91360 RepID=A0A1H0NBJ0_9BACT|nr:dihydroorotate dehydrogenase electron transfer subunit [Desulforhopalus singaporensis]SDO89896.1 dihydroorotate oxidase B, electron transfer subunit [Desulforhopalus singaporensis]
MSQYQENATVTRVEQFSATNYRITLNCPEIAGCAEPGQFVMVRTTTSKDPLLRRPFSIHQCLGDGSLQLYFKVVGRGTDLLSKVSPGEKISVFGPLGRGYRLNSTKPAIFVGGGMGIAPLLFLVKEYCRLKKECGEDIVLLGGRDKSEVAPLVDDFEVYGPSVVASTDDGSFGQQGFVTELLQNIALPPSCVLYGCGPEPMLKALGAFCRDRNIECQVSVESVMACGMGACLGCSRPAKDGTYTHVCVHGPVFDAEKLAWNI